MIPQNFDKYSNCPCESLLNAKFCCYQNSNWYKKKSLITLKQYIGVEKKCYANILNNCDGGISKEHYISHNILKTFEENKSVKIMGLPWIAQNTFSLISPDSLTAKILCVNHNSALSTLDNEMGRFMKTIKNFDSDFISQNPQNDFTIFSGEDIERWMLKTICDFIASKNIAKNGKKEELIIKNEYLDIIFNNKDLPKFWGLYFSATLNQKTQKFDSFSLLPFIYEDEIKAVEFLFHNFKFYLILGTPNYTNPFGVYRPQYITFSDGIVKKTIQFSWNDKKYSSFVDLKRIGTTSKLPQNWDDHLKS